MERRRLLAALAAVAAGRGAGAAPSEALVFAAASLTDALEEISAGYTRRTGERVVLAFGGSGDLARQIRAGAKADLFLSADLARVEALRREGRVSECVELLSNWLVVIAPSSSRLAVRSAADLGSVRRLALADPESVPAGAYAREWLARVGLWPALRARVVPTLDVRAALAAVESASADAGIVYRTDALGSTRARVVYEVPRAESPRIVYPAALLLTAGPAGRRFLAYLQSAPAREVFARLGFEVLAGSR